IQLGTMADSNSNENTCVVCFKNVLYYSIGECDHPVCFECSTRMRVLCLQNECPICRQDLSRVVFTDSIQPYKELRNRVFSDRLFERQYKIGFCDEEIKQAYERLLENRCKICDKIPPFRTFSADGLLRNDKNFPALDGSGPSRAPRPVAPTPTTVAATIVRNSKPSVSIQLHSQPASASNFRLTQTSGHRISVPPQQKKTPAMMNDDDFPSLGIARDDHPSLGAATVQAPKVALINSQEMQALKHNHVQSHPKKAQLSSEAFPALSSTAAPVAPPQWITVSKSKDKQKPSKPEPPPQPREPSFNPVADFPTLPVNTSKSKKKQQPPPQPTQQPPPSQNTNNDNTKLTKKEKKKQNSKKENLLDTYNVNGTNDKKLLRESYASVNANNNIQPAEDKKVKTVDTVPSGTVNPERNRNGGNGDFSLADKDYPPLNSRSENCIPSKKVMNGSVPPGFKPRPACDGMTFTNSAGQTFSAPLHTYIPPPNFEHRNRALVKKFAVALGGDAAVEDFKVASRAFRDSSISAEQFHAHCRAALGAQFEAVFPELVALLPDIAKQQELVVARAPAAGLAPCAVCGQLLAPADAAPHHAHHWPALAAPR
ncbi:hypothetical protein HF086_007436, partial [Spodoptera exigua]